MDLPNKINNRHKKRYYEVRKIIKLFEKMQTNNTMLNRKLTVVPG